MFEPQTAAELREILDQIALAAKLGARPIIHLDTHGSEDKGIFIAGSREFVALTDLYGLLRAINIATGNNLCIISAACYGMQLIKEKSVTAACPFFVMLAPQETVSFGFLEQTTVAFYQDVFEDLNILGACEKHLKPGLSIFHSERMLAVVLARYFKFKSMGRGGRERREGLLTLLTTAATGAWSGRRRRR